MRDDNLDCSRVHTHSNLFQIGRNFCASLSQCQIVGRVTWVKMAIYTIPNTSVASLSSFTVTHNAMRTRYYKTSIKTS